MIKIDYQQSSHAERWEKMSHEFSKLPGQKPSVKSAVIESLILNYLTNFNDLVEVFRFKEWLYMHVCMFLFS